MCGACEGTAAADCLRLLALSMEQATEQRRLPVTSVTAKPVTPCTLSHSAVKSVAFCTSLAASVTTATAVSGGGDRCQSDSQQHLLTLLTLRRIAAPSTLAAALGAQYCKNKINS